MSQVTSGLHGIFSMAPVYSAAQRSIGAERLRRIVALEYLRPAPGMRILDIGSGTSDIVAHLPEVDYIGLEPSEKYAAAAAANYGDRVTIIGGHIEAFDPSPWTASGDLVMALGVLHHLSDDHVRSLFDVALRLLSPNGRFVAVDPCLHPGQGIVARTVIRCDRGQRVRTPDETLALAREVFPAATVEVRTDLLRIPYSHAILTA